MTKGLVVVTGAAGQLGQPLCQELEAAGYEVRGVDIQDFNLCDASATLEFFRGIKADAIFHCAAMTAVDLCEAEPERAFVVNAWGTQNLCQAAAINNSRVFYISTDYVFPGDGQGAWHEWSEVAPKSVYGQSKRAGEEIVLRQSAANVVVRISWLFGPHGKNFVEAILNRARSGHDLKIVSDQRGIPTYAPDLAKTLVQLLGSEAAGVVHAPGGDEAVSWFEFGQRAVKAAGYAVNVEPQSTAELNRPAPRPANSVLAQWVLPQLGLRPVRAWSLGLDDYVAIYRRRNQP